MSEQDALMIHPTYHIQRSGNLIERATLNNVAAGPDCRLLRIVYASHGRIVIQALNDQLQVQHELGLIRTNRGFHVPQFVASEEGLGGIQEAESGEELPRLEGEPSVEAAAQRDGDQYNAIERPIEGSYE